MGQAPLQATAPGRERVFASQALAWHCNPLCKKFSFISCCRSNSMSCTMGVNLVTTLSKARFFIYFHIAHVNILKNPVPDQPESNIDHPQTIALMLHQSHSFHLEFPEHMMF